MKPEKKMCKKKKIWCFSWSLDCLGFRGRMVEHLKKKEKTWCGALGGFSFVASPGVNKGVCDPFFTANKICVYLSALLGSCMSWWRVLWPPLFLSLLFVFVCCGYSQQQLWFLLRCKSWLVLQHKRWALLHIREWWVCSFSIIIIINEHHCGRGWQQQEQHCYPWGCVSSHLLTQTFCCKNPFFSSFFFS